MSFSEYMMLKEGCESSASAAKEKSGFKEVDPPTEGGTTSNDAENRDFGDEPVKESDEFGEDKLDAPESEGLDAAQDAMSKLADASDGEDTDIDLALDSIFDDDSEFDTCCKKDDCKMENTIASLSDEKKQQLREACEYIIAMCESDEEVDMSDMCDDDGEEIAVNGEEEDDHIENGIDLNTIVPHNDEADQFSPESESDSELEESFTGWDDLE